MRSVVQGVELRASWDRYLRLEGQSTDLRVVRSTIAWIRDEFAAAARREDRYGTARLVMVDASRVPEPDVRQPTLEDFARSRGMADERQADQIEAFEAAFGKASTRVRRRARLIDKQLQALRWLEDLIAQPPRAGDAVSSWLHPTLARQLESAGLYTVAQLVDRINGLGRRWHSGIRSMGQAKAQRIVDWLADHQATIGLTLGGHVGSPRAALHRHELAAVVAPATDIRPLEKFIVPRELDGSRGRSRRPQAQCLIDAGNDHQAILVWLRDKHGLTPDQKVQQAARRKQRSSGIDQGLDWLQALSHTQRAYRKEAERFLLWAVLERGTALSSIDPEDCAVYRAFLADPRPADRWCGERSRERWSPLWRPFEGPLSTTAQRYAIVILKNLYRFLVDRNYLMGSPWAGVALPLKQAPKTTGDRAFSAAQWAFIEAQLERIGEHSTGRRLKLGLRLLYATGLRLSEIVAAKLGHMRWVEYPADAGDDEPVAGWLLAVEGRGARAREVPVPVEVVTELAAYLASRGLAPEPGDPRNGQAFVLGKASDLAERAPGLAGQGAASAGAGIAAHTFYEQLKTFFGDCADVLAGQGDAIGAARFQAASTHWMRHTHAIHAIAGGMPIEIAQENLGHASLASTTPYVQPAPKRRMKAVNGMRAKRG